MLQYSSLYAASQLLRCCRSQRYACICAGLAVIGSTHDVRACRCQGYTGLEVQGVPSCALSGASDTLPCLLMMHAVCRVVLACLPACRCGCLQEDLAVLESRLFELAGHPLNLASRQQLSQVIFQELRLQPRDPKYRVPRTKASGLESTKEVSWLLSSCLAGIPSGLVGLPTSSTGGSCSK
jgi:hypothetical protein